MKIDRVEIYNKMSWKCWYCWIELKIKEMQVDHIIPQRNFKRDIHYKEFNIPNFLKHLDFWDINHIDNLICTCRSCNNYKSALNLEDFRKEVWLQIERLNKNPMYRLAKRYGLIQENPKKIIFYFETLYKTNLSS